MPDADWLEYQRFQHRLASLWVWRCGACGGMYQSYPGWAYRYVTIAEREGFSTEILLCDCVAPVADFHPREVYAHA